MSEPTQLPNGNGNGNSPALSVILAVGSQRARAGRALQSLIDQNMIDRMEILLFDLGPKDCPPLPGSDHPRVKVTRWDPSKLLCTARVNGIHAAKSPVVCFMEEHCEMLPGWAQTVTSAHQESWAAVGTDFINGNPNAGSSNRAFRMNYGVYVRPPTDRGPTSMIAGQNSSFKRDVLLQYEPNLEFMLNAELVLQWQMLKDGYRILYEPSVQIAHKNENTLRSHMVGAFYWNWCFSNIRARTFQWSLLRRATWIGLAPLIPWVRLLRIGRSMLGIGFSSFLQFIRDIPFVLVIAYASAAGQVVGLVRPIERAAREFSHFEMNEPRLSRAEYSS